MTTEPDREIYGTLEPSQEALARQRAIEAQAEAHRAEMEALAERIRRDLGKVVYRDYTPYQFTERLRKFLALYMPDVEVVDLSNGNKRLRLRKKD